MRNPISDFLLWQDLTDKVEQYHEQHKPAPIDLFSAQFDAFENVMLDGIFIICGCLVVLIVINVWRFRKDTP